MSSNFGIYLKSLREEKGLTLNQLAELSGVSNAQISRIENGLRELPRPETIRKLAAGLNTSQTDLMEKAGYFEGLDTQKKSGVKNYLRIQEALDATINELIKEAYESGQDKEVFKTIGKFLHDDLEHYLEEKELEKLPTSLEDIADFIRFCDMSLETKADFIQFLKKNIVKESPAPNEAEKELFDRSLDLSDEEIKQRFDFKVDGHDLTEEEYQRMIAAVRAERLYRNSQQ
ncbi:helix-turn-helix domain-containing protein [Paenibacillus ihumii]|uniref:helix-turn-helix domain-containing protein n=1 Tax=Paenibacillus ihumii TaxID=687436 RepID=UPI00093BFDD6|nr:helix-turn-helix transcriptional regulator [Paenibacillus ihumii]